MKITNLGSIVDTLKINATFDNCAYETKAEYQSQDIEDEIISFNKKVLELVELKKQAMEIRDHDSQKRFIPTEINGIKFHVMASATESYSVILQNGDISIFLRKFSKKVKNPVIKVEFRAEYLCKKGYVSAVNQVQRLISYEFISNPVYRVKEIHLATDVQGYEFSPLDFYRIKTNSKNRTMFNDEKNTYFTNQRFTGMTFGKGDFMLRIYNKTVEINKNKKKGFIEVLKWQHNPEFDNNKNVWRIEGQIRRDKLKQLSIENSTLNLDNLTDVLNAIPSIWKFFISNYVHKNLSAQQVTEQIQGFKTLKKGGIKLVTPDMVRMRFKKADLSIVWNEIQTFNGHVGVGLEKFDDIKAPEVEYVENAYKALMSTSTKFLKGNFSVDKLIDIIHEANLKTHNKTGKTIMERCRYNALDYMSSAKFFYQKNGFVFDGFDEYEKETLSNLKEILSIGVIYDNYRF